MKAEIEQQTESAPETSGQLLSQAREKMQLTVEDVAARLNLRATVITAIEQDDEAQLPSPTFVRGYLRAYARLVGLPEQQVLDAYKGEASQTNMQSFSNRTSNERSDSRVMWLTYVIVLVLVACLVAWWWQKQQQSKLAAESAVITEVSSASEQVAEALEQLVESQSNGQMPEAAETLDGSASFEPEQPQALPSSVVETPAESSPVSSDESATEVDASLETVAEDQAETTSNATTDVETQDLESASSESAMPEQDPVELATVRFTLSKDCWMRVEDATGEVVAEGVKTPSRDVIFQGVPPFSAIFGVPDAVAIEYQGEPYPFEVRDPLKTLRLTFPAE